MMYYQMGRQFCDHEYNYSFKSLSYKSLSYDGRVRVHLTQSQY